MAPLDGGPENHRAGGQTTSWWRQWRPAWGWLTGWTASVPASVGQRAGGGGRGATGGPDSAWSSGMEAKNENNRFLRHEGQPHCLKSFAKLYVT